jgi:cellulose synthase/poly-beta-1,6-N-acetylglucosamine synthase-like glycosyltransferase
MNGTELVTVVVPACNEERFLGACLESIQAQDYPALQIVVVDGASTDATAAIVRARTAEDDRVELLHNDRRNIPSSLNLAVAQARGRWLVRVDAHSMVGPTYVSTAVERLREGTWAGVGGRKDGVGQTPAGRAIAVAMASRFGVGNSTYHFGTTAQEVDHLAFGAYQVDIVRQLGGWDERLTANEDFEFDHRIRAAGLRLLFDPRLVIRWHCRQSVADLYRQYHRYGRGKVDVAWLHPESLHLRHLAPPAFVAYAAAGLLVNRNHLARWFAMMAPYVLAVTGESIRAGGRLESRDDRFRLPGAFVAMHIGWGVGFWSGVASTLPRQTRGWLRTTRS